MFFFKGNTVTFKKGFKPRSIKTAQKEVRMVYEMLCEADAPRLDSLARIKAQEIVAQTFKVTIEQISQASPALLHSIDTAVRAYCAVGNTLLSNTKMFSMDLLIPVGELKLYPDLPSTLVTQALGAPSPQIKITAREG